MSKAYARRYSGKTFRIQINAESTVSLEKIGGRGASKAHTMPYLPKVAKGWKSSNAYFKVEGTNLNIGLGDGKALNIFNTNIKTFKIVY